MRPRFAETIQTRADDLTKSERRLVTSVLSQPRAAALASVTDLAREAGVHEATVSRLARKLGFEGYPAFRSALQEEFLPREETATRLQRTLRETGDKGVLASLIRQEVAALNTLVRHVEEAGIAAAANTMMHARRLYVFATGNAEALAHLMVKRFRRFGRDVHPLTGDARALAEEVLGMAKGDVLVICAFRRTPKHYQTLVAHAHEVGARVIVIADTIGHVLVPAPDLLLCAPRSADTESFQTLTVPMAIANAIVIAAGSKREKQTLQTLERLGALIRKFD